MATIKDVASRAGVSTTTVSRVLAGKLVARPETTERVQSAAASLGYHPNILARGLVTRRTGTIAVVVTDICDPVYPLAIRGIVDVATANGYSLFLVSANTRATDPSYHHFISQYRVDGAIIYSSTVTDEEIKQLQDHGVRTVLINRHMPDIPSIAVDGEQGGYLATQHLLTLGHRRIAYISGSPNTRQTLPRRNGYERALREANLALDPALIVAGDSEPEGGTAAMERLLALDQPPTAVFSYNDMTAIGALEALKVRGVRVPDDLSVVGYDGIEVTRFLTPALTTIEQPRQLMGMLAMKTLLYLLRDEPVSPDESARLVPQLVLRQSTAPPRR
ncbi:MAG: LacI family transcriptional regulator [Chloroflexi bacterium]|nr:LacI family transcriptional regulator [Chloroflexota bacterium]